MVRQSTFTAATLAATMVLGVEARHLHSTVEFGRVSTDNRLKSKTLSSTASETDVHSLARSVRAAQFAVAGNRGFFTRWLFTGFSLRSLLTWFSPGHTNVQARKPAVQQMQNQLDDITFTSGTKKEFEHIDLGRKVSSVARITGRGESLTKQGYQTVAVHGDHAAMMTFMRRVAEKDGLLVQDNATLADVARFYDGECAMQTFRNLRAELHRALKPYLCHNAWVVKKGEDSRLRQQQQQRQQQTDPEHHANMSLQVQLLESGFGIGDAGTELNVAMQAAFSEEGYAQVAAAGSTEQTAEYIKRVLDHMGLEVKEAAGLEHFAPFYSGECAVQSFSRLSWELRRASSVPRACGGGWVQESKHAKGVEAKVV